MTRLSNTAAWILSGTLFLVAVAWTNLTGFGLGANQLTYDDVALPRFAVALVGAAAVWLVLAIMLAKGNQLLCDPTWWLLGALATWSIVSALFARTTLVWLGQSERLEGVATIVLYAVLFGAGLQLGRSQRNTRLLASAFALAAVPLALHGLLQTAKLDPTNYIVSGASFYLGSAFASLGNPNFLAGLLVLALPIAVALALVSVGRLAQIAWWLGALAIVGAVYATYSQGAWLAVIIELALAAGLWAWSRQLAARGPASENSADAASASRRSIVRIAAVVALIVVLGVAVIVGVTTMATNAGLRLWGSSLRETGSGRLLLLQTTLNAASKHPLLGYGPDNFLAAFRMNRPDRWVAVFGETATNANAHSWLLQYTTNLGVVGGLLLAAALGFGLVRSRPRAGVSREEPADLLAAAVWIGAVGFVVQMMFNVAMLASTVPFWVLLGAISAPRAWSLAVPRAPGVATVAVCGLLVVASVVGSGVLLAADSTYIGSRLAYNGAAAGDAVALAEKAAVLNPLSVKYARAVAQSRSQRVFAAIAAKAPASEVRALHDEASAAFDRTLGLSPNDYATLSWLAGLQAATGTYLDDSAMLAEAGDTARRAAALDRTHWGVALLVDGDASAISVRLATSEPGLP